MLDLLITIFNWTYRITVLTIFVALWYSAAVNIWAILDEWMTKKYQERLLPQE